MGEVAELLRVPWKTQTDKRQHPTVHAKDAMSVFDKVCVFVCVCVCVCVCAVCDKVCVFVCVCIPCLTRSVSVSVSVSLSLFAYRC